MSFLEKDLEDIIFDTDNQILCSRGLPIRGKKFRQLRIGNYGVADIVSYRKKYSFDEDAPYIVIDIWELKKGEINIETLLQALKYCKGIMRYLWRYRGFYSFNININLVGRSIDTRRSFIYLTDLIGVESGEGCECRLTEISYYTYEYDFDGISFREESGYGLINEGFGICQTE